jgi:IclR family acetate operon transcriptional repressor
MTVVGIDRCLSVLEALAGEPAGLDLRSIADRICVPKSAVHRVLGTLVQRGYVSQDSKTLSYTLPLRFSLLAFRDLDARGFSDAAQAALDDLACKTGEYCRLAVAANEGLTWVVRAQGAPARLRYEPCMGQEIVLHATANGKAWLATLPEDEALRIVCARGFKRLQPLGPRAIKTVDEFRKHLAETRRRGYALAVEKAEPGIVAIAVAFRADTRTHAPVAGTMSVAGPLVRLGPDRWPVIARALHSAAVEVAAPWPLRKLEVQQNTQAKVA